MAYFKSGNCGSLRLNSADFTQIDGVITSKGMEVDTYTPEYSTGVTATFDADKYADTYEKATKTFTASVAELIYSWSDGTSTLTEEDMADIGLTDIAGAVDGSTITVTYVEEEVPRTELVGNPFNASMCGGQKFDDGVFAQVGDVITTVGTTSVASSFRANCSLLFDGAKFELGDDNEIVLK